MECTCRMGELDTEILIRTNTSCRPFDRLPIRLTSTMDDRVNNVIFNK
jgi:hypothetical protein